VTIAAAGELDFVRACLSLTMTPDIRTIALGHSTDFSTGDIYRALHSSGCVVPGQEVNWDCFAPLKVRVFFWILRLQRTKTRALLHHLVCVASPDCPFCPGTAESISHLFICCPRLGPLWDIVSPLMRPRDGADLPALLNGLSEDLPRMHVKTRNTAVLALLWSVWKSRNKMVFDVDPMSTTRVVAMVVDHLRLWIVCASARVDTGPLLAWCQSIS
jgi:hypothetical protein